MPDKCVSKSNKPLIKVEEGHRKAVFSNAEKAEFAVGRVDGCLITAGPRCDFFVTKTGVATVFVELKGTDISHACLQLFSTARANEVKPWKEKKVGFLIICRRVPRIDTTIQKAKLAALREFRAGLKIFSDQREVDLETITNP